MFTHTNKQYHWPKVSRKNINGKRHYVDESGNIYNSVTRVVNDGKDFTDWYQRLATQYKVSLEAAEAIGNYVKIQSGNIGTKLHSLCEDYLNNKPIDKSNIFVEAHFENIKDRLDDFIKNIHGIEIQMFSKSLGLAGTVDCVAEWGGVLSVIDFKTTKKSKDESWIESYFLQATAYSLMWEENTGEKIDQIVIVFTGEDGSQDTIIKDKAQYVDRLHEVIDTFNKQNNIV